LSIRARIFFVFVAAVITGFTLLAIWIRDEVADRYSESFEEVMVDSVNLLAEIITTDLNNGDTSFRQLADAFGRLQSRRFSARVYELEKNRADIRVYVTDSNGLVIFDSDDGKDVGVDYSRWRDVYLTLRGDYGARTTKIEGELSTGDPTQPLSIAYVAAPIFQQSELVGVVTLAKPKNNIDLFIANAKASLVNAVIFAVFLALLLGLMLYIWVSRPLQALVDYANAVGRGERAALPQLGNNEIGEVGIAIDNMRQALEDKQYVEHYVQSLTHEIKSPLTAIHAAAELLAGELPADKREQFAGTITREADRLSEFASQLLQLAALEKSPGIDKHKAVSVEDLTREIVETRTLECQARNLITRINVRGNTSIYGDAFLLRQAIDNLLRNAIEFSPAGGEIRVDIEQSNKAVVVSIRDQGQGIPDFAIGRVFERFYSLPRPGTDRKSSGLGLNFAREVAIQHGGSLSLENNNPGACATVCLPQANG